MILRSTVVCLLLAHTIIVRPPIGLKTLNTKLYQVVSYPDSDYLTIRNKSNQLYKHQYQAQLTTFQREYGLSSINSESAKLQLKQIIFSRLRKLPTSEPSESLTTFLYVNDAGKVLEVDFIIKHNTCLPLQRLAFLEESIKKKINFEFRNDSLKGMPVIKFGLITHIGK